MEKGYKNQPNQKWTSIRQIKQQNTRMAAARNMNNLHKAFIKANFICKVYVKFHKRHLHVEL
jgi:hypothetical protein